MLLCAPAFLRCCRLPALVVHGCAIQVTRAEYCRVKFGPCRGAAILDIGAKTETYRGGHGAMSRTAPLADTADVAGGAESTGFASGPVDALAATMGSGLSLGELETTIGKMTTWQSSARSGKHSVQPFVEPEVMDELRQTVENPRRDIGGPQPSTVKQFLEGVTLGAGDYHCSTADDRAFCLNSGRYHAPYHSRPTKKRKLRLLKTRNYDKFLNSIAPPTQLVVVAVLQNS